MEKLAAIYERKGTVFVTPSHRTKAGFWIDDDVVVALVAPTPEELGRAIEDALERSQPGVPTPAPNARIDNPLLKAALVGSWGTFMKLSKHVSVSSDGGVMRLTPYRNLGSKGGFEPQASQPLQSRPSTPELGEAVMAALSQTE